MLKPEQIASVKGRGFLINRGTECFSGRIVCAGTVFTAADLRTISEIAEKFGSGKVTFTSRLSAEIVGIPFEQIDAACDYAAERGLYFGGTGAKIRPSPHVGHHVRLRQLRYTGARQRAARKILRRLGKCQTAAQVQNRHRRLPE